MGSMNGADMITSPCAGTARVLRVIGERTGVPRKHFCSSQTQEAGCSSFPSRKKICWRCLLPVIGWGTERHTEYLHRTSLTNRRNLNE